MTPPTPSAQTVTRPSPGSASAPSAWQYRESIGSDWGEWFCLNIPIEKFKEDEKHAFEDGLYEIRPLYAELQPASVAQGVQESLPIVTWWNGAQGPAERLAENLESYAKVRPGADRDKWAMAAAAKWIRAVIASSLPSTDREYDPNVAPCDDAEFGMKP